MWGFFESTFKVGFGVAFGFLVYDTIWLFGESVHSHVWQVIEDWPSWSLIIAYPLGFLGTLLMAIIPPLLILSPFYMIRNKWVTGKFSTPPDYSAKAGKESLYFQIVWYYCFWAVQFKLDAIG